jgi:ABC-2 type transport system permease protein
MSTVATAGSVFVGRSLRHSARDVEVLVMAASFPVILMLLFTYVFGGALTGGPATYAAYVPPGTVLLCAGFGAASTAVGVAGDLTSGMVDRLRRMPVSAWTVLVGRVVASLVRNSSRQRSSRGSACCSGSGRMPVSSAGSEPWP